MKKHRASYILAIFVLIAGLLLSSCGSSNKISLSVTPHSGIAPADTVAKPNSITEETRGVWIASVYNINFPSSPDLSEEKLKAELNAIVQNVLSYGMNTVYFQVHPASDAMYRSDLFPVSRYLFSDGMLHFDPLEYMAEICRENGISLFAWINPLRISVSSAATEEEARDALPVGSPGKDKELTVFYGDGKLYLNCGENAVRELVADAVEEIVASYDIDGIVFDDYFYPYPVNDSAGNIYQFNDTDSYERADTPLSLEDWRRDNVNQMIKLCYTRIKSHDPDILFGVAPFGIWQNDDGTNGGSDTEGMEAYSELYCDAVAWIKGKYVDFISPQLYWRCDSDTASFGKLISFWNSVTDGTGVDLIVSHGIYQYDTWSDPEGELELQIELARDCISYKGSILYGYDALLGNTSGITDETVSVFGQDVYYYHPSDYGDGMIISFDDGASVDGMAVTFDGYSDPNKPLTVNGVPVSRSHGGYFKCELMLTYGENTFEFVCGDLRKNITVIKNGGYE